MHRLDVDELAHAERAALAAEARVLDAAERHARIRAHVVVDEAEPGVELLGGDPLAAREIARQHARAEPEFARVGDGDRVALVAAMRGYEMGDPRDPATRLGPLQSVAARDQVHAQVEASVRAGARLLLGGVVPAQRGAWYPPTVLSGVVAGQPAHDEEVFGPVAAVIEAADESDAIAIANASEFGLGSGVLTRDVERGERIAAEALDAGLGFVNDNVRSDPRMPFGGVKHSGFGRECAGFGIREFVNIKSVHVKS